MANVFTASVIDCIKCIPCGKVTTYGVIAIGAGNCRGARQVSWILHTSSARHRLPWHRVVNRLGEISFRPAGEATLQRELLEAEGIVFDKNGRIDLDKYLWLPGEPF